MRTSGPMTLPDRSMKASQRSVLIPSTSCWCIGPTPRSRSARTCRPWPEPGARVWPETSVSPNFTTKLLDEAIALCPEPLVALQAEYHPYLDQSKLLPAVRRHGLVFIAYCPLGRGRLFNDPVLAEIAAARGRTIAQTALRWLLQQGVAAIPGSSNPQRIAENFNLFDFELSDAEMERISALKRPDGRIANPSGRVPGGWD